jgi:hypothetical protein
MNYNDIIAQQQAALNQAMQNAQHWQSAYVAIWLAGTIFSGWVIYMFYARLRDIADELRNIRITLQMAQERKAQAPSPPRSTTEPSGEGRYMPRPS